jgi:hypothetical protein
VPGFRRRPDPLPQATLSPARDEINLRSTSLKLGTLVARDQEGE